MGLKGGRPDNHKKTEMDTKTVLKVAVAVVPVIVEIILKNRK